MFLLHKNHLARGDCGSPLDPIASGLAAAAGAVPRPAPVSPGDHDPASAVPRRLSQRASVPFGNLAREMAALPGPIPERTAAPPLPTSRRWITIKGMSAPFENPGHGETSALPLDPHRPRLGLPVQPRNFAAAAGTIPKPGSAASPSLCGAFPFLDRTENWRVNYASAAPIMRRGP